MSTESVRVCSVACAVTVKSRRIGVSEFTITQGINSIPSGNFLLALTAGDLSGNDDTEQVVVYTKDDPATDYSSGDRTYDLCKDAQDNRDSIDINIRIRELGDRATSKNISISGWKITYVALQPQTRLSPGGVSITVQHPMCELLESPGFFYAPGANYEKILKDKEPTNIVDAADNMLDAIYEVISGEGYTAERLKKTNHYEALVAGAKVRLGKYLECVDDANGFPYEKRIPANLKKYYTKAARLAFALNFAQLPQSVPFNAMLSLCDQLGLIIIPHLSAGKKAEIRVMNPWIGRGDKDLRVKDEEVYSAQTIRDSDPICGIRLIASAKDSVIISTLTDIKPTQKESKTVGGEVMYYYNDTGRIINTTLPSFLSGIFSIMYRLYNKDRVRTLTNNNAGTKTKHSEYEDPKEQLKSLGLSNSAAQNVVDGLQNATAKAMFVLLHRKTQRASVTRPFIDDNYPDVGSFASFKAGTGGDNVTGMLVQNVIRGSVTQGICSITHVLAYCGDTAYEGEGGSKTPLKNEMWAKEDS